MIDERIMQFCPCKRFRRSDPARRASQEAADR